MTATNLPHLPGCNLKHGPRKKCSTWAPLERQPAAPIGRRPEPSPESGDRADILFEQLGAQTGDLLASRRALPEATPLERGRERLAAGLLVTHQIWFLLWITASLISGIMFCEGDGGCEGGWAFGWGMLWGVGELVLFVPVVLSTIYLIIRFFRGSTAAPLIGLGSWPALVAILGTGSVVQNII